MNEKPVPVLFAVRKPSEWAPNELNGGPFPLPEELPTCLKEELSSRQIGLQLVK